MENKDRLSEFIRNNKEEFDLNEPNPQVWQHLENQLDGNNSIIKKLFKQQWLRAAVLLMVVGSVLFYVFSLQNQVSQMATTIDSLQVQEQEEAFQYYQTSYNNKKNRLMQLSKNHYQQAEPDLKELEEAFIELKKELGDNYNNEEVIKRLIEHYQLKIKILERMIDIIEEYPEGSKSL